MEILASLPGGPDDGSAALKKYRDFFAETLLRVGEQRFSRAIDRCFRREHGATDESGQVKAFYPTPHDFERMIPAPPRGEPDPSCRMCKGAGYYRTRHCGCRVNNKTDTGLDGEADPRCQVCHGAGSLIDDDPKRNNRVKFCACKSRPA